VKSGLKHESKPTQKYLIIGGAPKAATTSLFNYLADHSEVCPANRKETYFFAREFDYKNVCTSRETLEAFGNYFSHCQDSTRWKVESTPYTLYSKDAAQKIVTMLQDATMLFVLRDPVQRLLSDYRMAKERQAKYVRNKTFEEYVDKQLGASTKVPNNLMLGCYIEYLRPFFEIFGRDKIIILFFEELASNPRIEMQNLCLRLGIDENFYSNYKFNIYNKTINPRSTLLNKAYISLEPVVANLRSRVMNSPVLHRVFENTIRTGKFFLRSINNQKSEPREVISTEVRAKLIDYYQSYNQTLSEELGRSLPWRSFRPNSRNSGERN